MKRLRWALIAALLCLLVAGAFDVPVSVAAPQKASDGTGTGGASGSAAPAPRAVLDQYCIACHNKGVNTAGLALDTLDLAKVGDRAEVWEKVVRKIRTGAMPPSGMHVPPAASGVPWPEAMGAAKSVNSSTNAAARNRVRTVIVDPP